jgi:fatty acid synthase
MLFAFLASPSLPPPALISSTLIWVHTFTTHNSPRYWHQAGQFLPERFLQPGAEYASSGPGQQAAAAAAAAGDVGPAGHAGSLQGDGTSSPPPGGSPRGGGGGAASQPLRFFPFSQGARDCIGQSLAKINYTATLAALLGRYSFKIAPQVSGTLVEMHCLIAMFLLGF